MTQHFFFSFPVEQEVHSSARGSDAAACNFPAVCVWCSSHNTQTQPCVVLPVKTLYVRLVSCCSYIWIGVCVCVCLLQEKGNGGGLQKNAALEEAAAQNLEVVAFCDNVAR